MVRVENTNTGEDIGTIRPGEHRQLRVAYTLFRVLSGFAPGTLRIPPRPFILEPASSGRLGRARLAPRLGAPRGLKQQCGKALARIAAVPFPGAKSTRIDDQHTLTRHAAAGQPRETRLDLFGQSVRAGSIETKLHRGRDLVDVLPTRPRGADVLLAQLTLVDDDIGRDIHLENPVENGLG